MFDEHGGFMQEIIQAFGGLTVGTVLVLAAGLAAIWRLYKAAKTEMIQKYKEEEEEKKKLQDVVKQVAEYPKWHQQSIEIRDKLASTIEEIKDAEQENAARLTEMNRLICETNATTARYRILRFNDELLHDQRHTKEHFDQVLGDITRYESFCSGHPEYENNKAAMAIKNIKRVYQKCSADNDFL